MIAHLLVISPVRNEAAHLDRVIGAMAVQTRRPDVWVVVDDGSTDGTREILARWSRKLSFLRLVDAAAQPANVKDRLAAAAAPRAFNVGLGSVPWATFTHIAKLDGDTELPPGYWEAVLAEFERDPCLGIAGGVRTERSGRRWVVERVPVDKHVPGALKCYSLGCFTSIGGMHERLGWDTIDETYARLRGYHTRALPTVVAVHHRPWGSADGLLRGRARHGQCAYIVHFPFHWVALRAVKTATERPRVLSGLAFLGGYIRAAFRSTPRVEDPEFAAFVRGEMRDRVRRAFLPQRACAEQRAWSGRMRRLPAAMWLITRAVPRSPWARLAGNLLRRRGRPPHPSTASDRPRDR